jgi:hypothetical protein
MSIWRTRLFGMGSAATQWIARGLILVLLVSVLMTGVFLAQPASAHAQVLDNSTDTMQQDLDSISELGETLSLRLQMSMDR